MNYNISNLVNIYNRLNNDIPRVDKLFFINLNCIKNNNYYNCCNMSNGVSNKIIFTNKIQSTHFNQTCSKSKYYNNNVIDKNHNISNKIEIQEL